MKLINQGKGIGTALLLCLAGWVQSQDLHFSQFMNNPMLTNPANTGFNPDYDYRVGGSYRNQWWSLPASAAFTGQGIYGQFLYLDPAEDLVGVVWGAWNTPNNGAAEAETYALMAAAAEALR